jgi:hypothetical protein
MGLLAFDTDSSTNGRRDTARELLKIHASAPGDRAQAAANLLHHNFLSHTFGAQGEWEVRTTLIANRRAWRYRSSVFLRGKETRRGFPPIDVDWTGQVQQAEAVTEEMLAAFAAEAAEVHCARCASLAEYSLMAALFSQTPLRHHRMGKMALVLFSIAALLTGYWWSRGSDSAGPEPPYQTLPPHSVRWQPLQVSYQAPAGAPFVLPLPALERTPEGIPVEVTLEASGDVPGWLELDPERLHIRGTAPLTAGGQTYRLIVRAHAEQGGDSRLLVRLTITGQAQSTPPPQLRSHWTW